MKTRIAFTALAALLATPMVAPSAAIARDGYSSHHRVSHSRGYYRRRCGSGNGATGTIVGGVGGAVLGNVVGGGLLGTAAGGVGGALLGRHIDKHRTRARRGC